MNVKLLKPASELQPMPSLPPLGGHRGASWMLTLTSLSSLVGAALASSAFIGRSAGEPIWYGFSLLTAGTAFFILTMRGHFRVTMMADATSRVSPIMASVATAGCFAIVSVAAVPVEQPDFQALAGLFAALFAAGLGSHLFGVHLLRRLWVRGRFRASALVYGVDDLANELAIEIALRPDYGVDVVGFIANKRALSHDLRGPVFDPGVDLVEVIRKTGADRLIIGPGTALSDRQAIRAARRAAATGMPVFVVPRFFEMGLGMNALAADRFRGYPVVRLQRSVHPQLSIRLKRLLDVSVSLAVLLMAAPVLLLLAGLVKATSPGPMFFTQTRIGQHGRPIVIRKFRSMRMSESSDDEWTADDRVTLLGRWLRRLNLDEIPQLYSVLIGDMSLVGPRPERPVFVQSFRREVPDYDDRHRMPVGITGLAQIVGLRGDTSITERIKYDNLYIDQWSFRSDLQILVKTISAIWRQGLDADRAAELERALEAATDARSSDPDVIDVRDPMVATRAAS